MAKVCLVKASAGKKPAAKSAKAVPGDVFLLDNEDDSFTVQGSDAAGNAVDISSVATIAVASSDSSALSLDAPVGMTCQMHALKPTAPNAPVIVTITANWADGSLGPFVALLPVDVKGTAATGLLISLGTPSTR